MPSGHRFRQPNDCHSGSMETLEQMAGWWPSLGDGLGAGIEVARV